MIADAAHARDAEPKARIFISYSRKDMAFADRLEAALKARGCGKVRPSGSPHQAGADNAGWKRDLAWFDDQIATLTK